MNAHKTFYLPVTGANGLTQAEFDIPREVQTITGISFGADQEALMYARGSAEISIAGTDIIKAGEPTKQYYFTPNNPTRSFPFATMSLKNTDNKINVRYTDKDAPGTNFSNYVFQVTLHYIRA